MQKGISHLQHVVGPDDFAARMTNLIRFRKIVAPLVSQGQRLPVAAHAAGFLGIIACIHLYEPCTTLSTDGCDQYPCTGSASNACTIPWIMQTSNTSTTPSLLWRDTSYRSFSLAGLAFRAVGKGQTLRRAFSSLGATVRPPCSVHPPPSDRGPSDSSHRGRPIFRGLRHGLQAPAVSRVSSQA